MAIIHLQYIHCIKGTTRTFDFNTVTGAITSPHQDAARNPDAPGCTDDFELLYQDDDWQVFSQVPYPYANVVTRVSSCDLEIEDVTFTYDQFTGLAEATVDIDNGAGGDVEYSVFRVGMRRPWQTSNVFSNLEPGEYMFQVRRVVDQNCAKTMVANVATSQLAASVSAISETARELNDGKVVVNITNGSGNYRVDWLWDATFTNVSGGHPLSAQRSGLPAGTYMVQVFDVTTGANQTFTVQVTEPTVPVPSSNHFLVPRIQSLRFVQEEIVDDINTFENPDNTLYCKSRMPFMEGVAYYQKVAMADRPTVQFQSNYEDAEVILRDFQTDEVVEVFAAARTVQNIGQESLYPITIRNHGAGQSRVYFSTPAIPLPLRVGETFAIANNLDGFSGSYSVVDMGDDPILQAQYLVINVNYGIAAPTSSATGKFYTNVVHFDIWEAKLLFGNIPEGYYYATIKVFTGEVQRLAVSEPIDLKPKHEGTLMIEFYHKHNKFDMNYQTSIVNRIRVDGRMHDFVPGGEDTLLRNTDGTLKRTQGTPFDRYKVDIFQQPAWRHRMLNSVFRHSYISINGVEVQAPEGYAEPRYLTRYTLASVQIIVELISIFNTYNGTGVGIDNESGYLKISENGFLKVT